MIQSKEMETWERIIPDCQIVFDVGCRNDRMFYEINPNADIHLFDPIEREGQNNFALGQFPTKRKRIYTQVDSMIYMGYTEYKYVEVKRLDDYCKENNIDHIDFLKIDTEGFDFEVIKGCGRFIKNIKYIQFEDFERFYGGRKLKDILKYLSDHYFWEIVDKYGSPLNYLLKNVNF